MISLKEEETGIKTNLINECKFYFDKSDENIMLKCILYDVNI